MVGLCEECQDISEFSPNKFHVGCANLSQEVNHFSHLSHPLMLVTTESLFYFVDTTCLLCGGASDNALYHCSTCNFTLCPFCGKNPPPSTILNLKTHNHQLTLWPRNITFTCNVCGLQGDRSPYICFPCNFMIHRECFALPRVININRHDHRVSLTSRVGLLNSKCGVCRKWVNPYYGGYSCAVCPNYIVHPQCAMKKGVSDLVELEGTPEDPIIPPYIVVGDDLIQHFSHEEHYLRLNKDDVVRDESWRCEACVLPVYSDPIYSCETCIFMLHKTCANLPMKKRLVFSHGCYTLHVGENTFPCSPCKQIFNGYSYMGIDVWGKILDVSCGSLSEPFLFDGHSHFLYYKEEWEQYETCAACDKRGGTMLGCDDCNFQVHLRCATLPKKVKHTSDGHYLTLCYGEEKKGVGKYWCDICELETDPIKWFYTCSSDCGVTLHIQCVLGDFSRLMPNRITNYDGVRFEVVPNNKSDRPFCRECNYRCLGPFFLKLCEPNAGYLCSEFCLDALRKRR